MTVAFHPAVEGLDEIRQEAKDRFAQLGLPTSRQEDWRFTDLSGLTSISFERAVRNGTAGVEELIGSLPCLDHRLVFVNGYNAQPQKRRDNNGAREHLCRYADYRTHPFVALNTASFEEPALVNIRGGTEPIHVIHVSLPGSSPRVSHPRNLLVLGEGSQAAVIESYLGRQTYFTNAVTEIVMGEGSILDYYKLQMEAGSSFHMATVQVQQARGSILRSHSLSFGGTLARTEINTVLAEGSEATLNGLYIAGGSQQADSRTSIDHAQPHGASHELYKGILDGRSNAVFNGRIIVRKDAQKTDAKQTNKNLVLSEGATINTKPELQIHADDVRCTHGATIGQLDEEALFYLRSRGIGRESARQLLIAAFAREIVDGIRIEPLRSYVEQILAARLAGGAA